MASSFKDGSLFFFAIYAQVIKVHLLLPPLIVPFTNNLNINIIISTQAAI